MPAVSRQELVETEAADHVAHRRLADLIDGVVNVLDDDHRLLRIGDVIVGNRGNIDRDVVLGDDLLRRDLHGDGAQGYPHHLLKRNKDQSQSGPAHALELAQEENDPALVLAQNAQRYDEIDNDRSGDDGEFHSRSIAQARRCRYSDIQALS